MMICERSFKSMATKWLGLTVLGLAAGMVMAADTNTDSTLTRTSAVPRLQVTVDARVELLSLLFRLAGNPEYNQARVTSYTADVEKQFNPLREQEAVQIARKLRQTRGVSYDACMSLAVHLTDAYKPQLSVPLQPWPEGLDQRWTTKDVTSFLAAVSQFVQESSFKEFIAQHQPLYDTTAARMRALMEKEGHLEWFGQYFGERPQAAFTLVLGLLNGGSCYGPHYRDAAGKEELFCILGVWATDKEGSPVFGPDVLGTVVHEFCHSYANPIIDRHTSELETSGEELFRVLADEMRSQAYGNAQTMLRESLVRACVVRYLRQYGGAEAADREIRQQKQRGFLWMQELSDLLGVYETERDRYPTLEAFAPRLVAFFRDYARDFAQQQASLEAKRPKVVSLVPANGATNIDPGLKTIQVVFDRPMRDGSWSMCGGGPNFPETTSKPSYDATRTTWTAPVNLKPGWEYEFRLNAGQYQSFQSEEGVPLKSVLVRFRTSPQTP